jgi:hypothetical protein
MIFPSPGAGCWVVGVRPGGAGWSAINIARLPGSLTETGGLCRVPHRDRGVCGLFQATFYSRPLLKFEKRSRNFFRIRFGAKRLDFMVMADAR